MKFIFADSLDYVDPNFDFIEDRSSRHVKYIGMINIRMK